VLLHVIPNLSWSKNDAVVAQFVATFQVSDKL